MMVILRFWPDPSKLRDSLSSPSVCGGIRHPLGCGQIPAKRGSNKTLHPSGETERGASRAAARVLNEAGKLDYRALKPVLFEMPTYEYLRTGDVLGRCMTFGQGKADRDTK